MPRKRKITGDDAVPEAQQIFRYWVELRDLREGSTRNLPLTAIARIHLPTKKNAPQLPSGQLLQLQDGPTTLEAKDLDELAAQLGQRYPDDAFERTLRRERDHEAEQRRKDAMDVLMKLVAKAAVAELAGARHDDTSSTP